MIINVTLFSVILVSVSGQKALLVVLNLRVLLAQLSVLHFLHVLQALSSSCPPSLWWAEVSALGLSVLGGLALSLPLQIAEIPLNSNVT